MNNSIRRMFCRRFGAALLCIVACSLFMIAVAGCGDSGASLLPDVLTRREKIVERLTPDELCEWQLIGKGEVTVDSGGEAILLAEGKDSKGVALMSGKSYNRRVRMSFDVQPLSFEGVSFAFLSASDKVTMGELKVPEEFRGNMDFWTEGRVQNYLFAFTNGFHESKPFIKKNPGLKDIAVSRDLVKSRRVFSVEIGRRGRKLWIDIDGRTVVKGKDKERGGLPDGRVGFRLRGPGTGGFACLISNVVITEEK